MRHILRLEGRLNETLKNSRRGILVIDSRVLTVSAVTD